MASFNLGRIKGDKGDKGDTGPKGETGAKGNKGDAGENGADGRTPVFSIGETVTLSSSEEAYVELDCANPENPVLSFCIPRGKDGRDAQGDMLAVIYDSEGIKQDFYKYAKALADACLRCSGGTLSGALKAAQSPFSEGYVRNICLSTALPQGGGDGDICIVMQDDNAKRLSECSMGSIMLIEENGKAVPYIIAANSHHGENNVTLVRKELPAHSICYDNSRRGEYQMSDIDIFLETMYTARLSGEIQRLLVSVNMGNNVYRRCFLLSLSDLSTIEYFKTIENRRAITEGTGNLNEHYVRDLTSANMAYLITTTGTASTIAQNAGKYYRPAIVLPADLKVINTEYQNNPAVKLTDEKAGIYYCHSGEWKECSSL